MGLILLLFFLWLMWKLFKFSLWLIGVMVLIALAAFVIKWLFLPLLLILAVAIGGRLRS